MPAARGEKIVTSVPRSLLQLELRALDALADLVVARSSSGRDGSLRRVLERGDLLLAKAVELLRRGRVVAVAVDDHWNAVCLGEDAAA